jgi:molecular chaperone GrpE
MSGDEERMTDESNVQTNDTTQPAEAAGDTLRDAAAFEAELSKARDELLRALAEVENTRRRAERQAQDARTYAIDRFASDLLPVADTLSRAISAAPREGADEALRTLLAGLEMTEHTLIETFARHGLKRVGAKGESFDPRIHQAVAQTPSGEPAGVVIEVMAPGYVLGDRTLRAAMVVVSGGPAGAGPSVDIRV